VNSKNGGRREEHTPTLRVALERHCYVRYVEIMSLARDRLLFKIAHIIMFLKALPSVAKAIQRPATHRRTVSSWEQILPPIPVNIAG
jgi:hypothetical protein